MLSEKIKNLRRKYRLSQEELAERLQVSRQSVSKWECGSSTPEIEKIVQLSNLFQVSSTPEIEKIVQLSNLFQVTTDYLLSDANDNNDIAPSTEGSDLNRLSVKKRNKKYKKYFFSLYWFFITILYLIISFCTKSWHLTWLIWLIAAFLEEVLSLIIDRFNEKKT